MHPGERRWLGARRSGSPGLGGGAMRVERRTPCYARNVGQKGRRRSPPPRFRASLRGLEAREGRESSAALPPALAALQAAGIAGPFFPRASACGLSPGLCSADPSGQCRAAPPDPPPVPTEALSVRRKRPGGAHGQMFRVNYFGRSTTITLAGRRRVKEPRRRPRRGPGRRAEWSHAHGSLALGGGLRRRLCRRRERSGLVSPVAG
jgi:hypothetical protein